jgi:hypothetical protein
VQRTGHIRWGQLDAKVRLAIHSAGLGVALAFPFGAPVGFNGIRIKTFGKGHGVSDKKVNSINREFSPTL